MLLTEEAVLATAVDCSADGSGAAAELGGPSWPHAALETRTSKIAARTEISL
jgi:hypothetical protein